MTEQPEQTEQFVNRRGDRYYLLQGTTKTGKPKYYCSRKPTSGAGTPVERMPQGFEWHEHPETGIVSVRKIRPTQITSDEREMLSHGIRELAGLETFIVDVTENSLIVYVPDRNPGMVADLMGSMFGFPSGHEESLKAWTIGHAHYSPMMRFKLVNAGKRLFALHRWCFRGSIDDWLSLRRSAPLPTLIDEFVPHLDQDSFYELM